MDLNVKKVPSYLKGLAETRARAAGEFERLQSIAADVATRLAEAQANVASCDRLIRLFDERLDPTKIESIHAHRRIPGGKLKGVIVEVLEGRSPHEMTTNEVCWELQLRYSLDFVTPKERLDWKHGSIGRALKHLVKDGVVERLHDPMAPIAEDGRWRLKSGDGLSSDHSMALAAATGTSVHLCDDDPD
jgi:hypothetical protein